MIEFSFDEKGYLKPYDIIAMDLDIFETIFIFNNHREKLWSEYLEFMEHLKEISMVNFYQWINGSFVSRKILPKDIDVVTFLTFENYEQNEENIRILKNRQSYIDCYFVKNYPEDHSKHFITLFDKTEWLHLFSADRKRNAKGFVQINF